MAEKEKRTCSHFLLLMPQMAMKGSAKMEETNNFKPVYKRLKAKGLDLEALSACIDSRAPDERLQKMAVIEELPHSLSDLMKPASEWQCYRLKSNPDAIIIRNPFTSTGQALMLALALRDTLVCENRTNLDIHETGLPFLHPPHASRVQELPHPSRINPLTSLWAAHCAHHSAAVPCTRTAATTAATATGAETSSSTWTGEHRGEGVSTEHASDLMRKLTWATFGYHYNWTDKVYSRNDMTSVHPLLSGIGCHVAARVCGQDSFEVQGGIINYYTTRSALGPHQDHSEDVHELPLISISLGLPAVLLVGGTSLSSTPHALRVCRYETCTVLHEVAYLSS